MKLTTLTSLGYPPSVLKKIYSPRTWQTFPRPWHCDQLRTFLKIVHGTDRRQEKWKAKSGFLPHKTERTAWATRTCWMLQNADFELHGCAGLESKPKPSMQLLANFECNQNIGPAEGSNISNLKTLTDPSQPGDLWTWPTKNQTRTLNPGYPSRRCI